MKISIITINYNNGDGLKETIRSVIRQVYEHIQYIVIDGGSADHSKSVIEEYADGIDYWVSERDRGIYHAMNKGVQAATGEYLLFLNSGDTLKDSEVIKDVVECNLDVDLVYGDLIVINGDTIREWCPPDKLTFNTFYKESIPHPATFIRRGLFETVGLYNENYSIVSDWEFFMLALGKHNCTYKHCHRFVAVFAEGGISSLPENWDAMCEERARVIQEHFPLFVADYERFAATEKELKKIAYFINTRNFIRKVLKSFNRSSKH